MSYKHGIYAYEKPTSILPPVISDAGIPIVFGTAPINMAKNPKINEPVLCYTYAEAVEYMGYSDDWDKFTLCEFMHSQFALFQRAPVILVNVLDSEKHKKVDTKNVTLANNKIEIKEIGIIASTIKVSLDQVEPVEPYELGVDYLVSFNQSGTIIITGISEKVAANAKLKIECSLLDTSLVTDADIIGGIDISTGKRQGLELINEVFPRYRKVPGLVLAPGWSQKSEVAAVMDAKAKNINGIFKAEVLVDAPANINYAEVPEWKNANNYISHFEFTCWPKLKLGDRIYHLSTQLAGVIARTDALNRDIPYESPSNKNLQCDGAVLDSGEEVFLDQQQANYLNGEGVITALNFIGGWKVWGNRTSVYPISSDPKDSFIPVRRMFNWIANTLILTYWSKIGNPQNKRLIETVIDSANLWLNGLAAEECILGGRVEFLQEENPLTDVMDGILKFHLYVTPPSPAREIDFIMEYDVNYVKSFVESMEDKSLGI